MNIDKIKIQNYGLLAEFSYLKLECGLFEYEKHTSRNIYNKKEFNIHNSKHLEYFIDGKNKDNEFKTDENNDPLSDEIIYDMTDIKPNRKDAMKNILDKYTLKDFTSNDGFLSSDFQAMLFQDNSTKKYIIAFRGTAGFKDILADIIIAGNKNFQKNEAIEFVNNMIKKYSISKDDLTLTGHSLGGIISQELGAELQLKAYSFNPLGSSKLITGNSTIIQSAIEYLGLDKYQSNNFKNKVHWAKKNIYSVSYDDDGFLNGDILSNLATNLALSEHPGMIINVHDDDVGLGDGHSVITINKSLNKPNQILTYSINKHTLNITVKDLNESKDVVKEVLSNDKYNTLLKHDINITTTIDNEKYTIMKQKLLESIAKDNKVTVNEMLNFKVNNWINKGNRYAK